MKGFKIPKTTIERLPIYYRALLGMEKREIEVISSKDLGQRIGIPSAQVRKDLSYYGEFGRRGVGYEVPVLRRHLQKILGLEKDWPMLIVGAGNLGRALINYQGFLRHGLEVRAIFDNDPRVIGTYIHNLKVEGLDIMEEKINGEDIKLGIIAVPAEAAQEVADRMVGAGIKGIWNFSPEHLQVPEDVTLRNEDLSVSLMALVYHLNYSTERSD